MGSRVTAVCTYIGGYEGTSEYWWLRTDMDGNRQTLSTPKPVPVVEVRDVSKSSFVPEDSESNYSDYSNDDPRVYVITPGKCRVRECRR